MINKQELARFNAHGNKCLTTLVDYKIIDAFMNMFPDIPKTNATNYCNVIS